MTTLRTALSLLTATLAVVLSAAPAQGAVPPRVPLATGWSYHVDGAKTWQPIQMPHVFDPHPDKSQFGGSVGWYRLHFRAPQARAGFDWGIHFDQARRTAQVWLNGKAIGTHSDPYVPFTLPATGLKAGQENTLLVRVDNRKGKEPREGWWNWGGLTRPVSLVPRGKLELTDQALMSSVNCTQGGGSCPSSVLFDGMLANRSSTPEASPTIAVTLTPPGGGAPIVHTEHVRALQPGETARVQFSIPITHPELWSPSSPALYAAHITTSGSSGPTQEDGQKVGLREVKVVNGLLELNGRQLDLRGAAVLEDVDGKGPVMSNADMDKVVAQLKSLHANITRSHYLLDDRLLTKLDEAGIMVWEQAPIYHRDRLLVTQAQRDTAISTLRNTVFATRRHASVITNSVANELSVIPDQTPGTKAYLDAAVATMHDIDPTLPTSVDLLSYPGYGAQRTYEQFDLLGINSYFGWYPGKPNHSTANIADLAPYLDHMRRLYPTQGLMLTEFGAESTFNGPPTEKQTYAFQSAYVKQVLHIVEDRPFVSGAIYWTLREFAVKPDWDGGAHVKGAKRDSIHHKGLITYAGKPKPAFAVAQKEYAATPLYRSIPSAVGLNRAVGHDGGSSAVLWIVVGGVLLLIVVDAWALRGILGARRARRDEAEAAVEQQRRPVRSAA